MKRISILLTLLIPLLSCGQQTLDGFDPSKSEDKTEEHEAVLISYAEKMPEYPGGDEALYQFIEENTFYPEEARSKGIEGKVYVGFLVEPTGELSDIKILKGLGGGCDEETLRVMSLMPKWNPAIQRGKPIAVQFRLPFYYELEGPKKKKKRKKK